MNKRDYLPIQLHTRLLYPFHHDCPSPTETLTALSSIRSPQRDQEREVWQRRDPHELYHQELLPNVERFLYQGEKRSCCYLAVDNDVANCWFSRELAIQFRGDCYCAAVSGTPGIELFLSPYGAGVLSLAVRDGHPPQGENALDELAQRVYRLAQLSSNKAPVLYIPRDRKQACSSERRTTGEQQTVAHLSHDSPLRSRLGVRDAPFRLGELIEFLLSPLTPRPCQSQLSAYSVVRFDEGLDLDTEHPPIVARLLYKLAQLEEARHPGQAAAEPGIPNAVLNTKHWAAVSYLGSAHLVADQGVLPGSSRPPEFNEQRVVQIRDKYFVAFLLALLSRLTLQRMVGEAGAIIQRTEVDGTDADRKLRTLRLELIDFAVEGHFTELSSRDVLNRYYGIARLGQGVEPALDRVRVALSDIDAERESRYRTDNTRNFAENLRRVTEVQNKVEWLEIFFVSFYAAKLAEILGHQFHFDPDFNAWSTVLWAIGAGLFAAYLLEPWGHHPPGKGIMSKLGIMLAKLLPKSALPIILAAGWIALGATTTHSQPQQTAAILRATENRLAEIQVRAKAIQHPVHPAIRLSLDLAAQYQSKAVENKRLKEYAAAESAYQDAIEALQKAIVKSKTARDASAVRDRLVSLKITDAAKLKKGQLLFDKGQFDAALRLWGDMIHNSKQQP